MIVGLGIDRIEIARVRKTLNRFGDRFKRRVFTDAEWSYCLSRPNPSQSLAARFAAKEAAMKALRRGWPGGIAYRDIEVVRTPSGAPSLKFSGSAAERAAHCGAQRSVVSLTHDQSIAAATVILEGDA
jgi:holo-[acyl-carrier protein] synthase